ncbi:unnamed protein product [Oppiella nova]|uniref:Poly [ADP-ribose] polymerase n=1 Tax=Oppiella nova TaxID=334625 RepID=A0A7R9QCM8_9ACAR|nr:unnamed protein product [Oppiella nova]CAG2163238.1 unnamed protein product [Oppiella nova]
MSAMCGHFLRREATYRAEYATSGWSTCHGCHKWIQYLDLRIGLIGRHEKRHKIWKWYHLKCFVINRSNNNNEDVIKVEDIEHFAHLRYGDQIKIIESFITDANADQILGSDRESLERQSDELYRYFDLLLTLKAPDLALLMLYNEMRPQKTRMSKVYALADAMTFGVPEPCPRCDPTIAQGMLVFRGSAYICSMGAKTQTLGCDYWTLGPNRRPFRVPDELPEEIPFLRQYANEVLNGRAYIPALTTAMNSYRSESPVSVSSRAMAYGHNEDVVDSGDIGYRVDAICHQMDELVMFDNESTNNNKTLTLGGGDVKTLTLGGGDVKTLTLGGGNVKILTLGGGDVVDRNCPLGAGYQVYRDYRDESYSAVLSYVKLMTKENYFYYLQLLYIDSIESKKYCLWRSWGDIGSKASGSRYKFFESSSDAISRFKQIFKDKTDDEWDRRRDFKQYPYKYYLVDVKYIENKNQIINLFDSNPDNVRIGRDIQELMKIIFNYENMINELRYGFKIDITRMPLGLVSKNALKNAEKCMNELALLLGPNVMLRDRETTVHDMSHEFYQNIPQKTVECIDSVEKANEKLQLLTTLKSMRITFSLLIAKMDSYKNWEPIDILYSRLNANINVLTRDSDEYNIISDYLSESNGLDGLDLQIDTIYELECKESTEKFKEFEAHNKLLLWHGTCATNLVGIITRGMRIESGAQPSGRVFGDGIYFADMAAKSIHKRMHSYEEFERKQEFRDGFPTDVTCVQFVGKTGTRIHKAMPNANKIYVPNGVITTNRFIQYPHRDGKRVDLKYNEYLLPFGCLLINLYPMSTSISLSDPHNDYIWEQIHSFVDILHRSNFFVADMCNHIKLFDAFGGDVHAIHLVDIHANHLSIDVQHSTAEVSKHWRRDRLLCLSINGLKTTKTRVPTEYLTGLSVAVNTTVGQSCRSPSSLMTAKSQLWSQSITLPLTSLAPLPVMTTSSLKLVTQLAHVNTRPVASTINPEPNILLGPSYSYGLDFW